GDIGQEPRAPQARVEDPWPPGPSTLNKAEILQQSASEASERPTSATGSCFPSTNTGRSRVRRSRLKVSGLEVVRHRRPETGERIDEATRISMLDRAVEGP